MSKAANELREHADCVGPMLAEDAADEIDKLESQLAAVTAERDALKFEANERFAQYIKESMERDAARVDALRYRWLRDENDCFLSVVDGDGDVFVGRGLDAEIDASLVAKIGVPK